VRIGVLVAVALAATAAPGTATAAPNVVAEPATHAFAPTAIGSSTLASLRFRNTGDEAADLGPPILSGPHADAFSIGSNSCSDYPLAAGATCVVRVKFAPQSKGSFGASLTIPSSTPGAEPVVSLSGSGVGSTKVLVAASPARVEFGTVPLQQRTAFREIVLQNVGEVPTSPLKVYGRHTALAGPRFRFNSGGCQGAILPPAGTCTISVELLPLSPGRHDATLLVLLDRTTSISVGVSAEVTEPPLRPRSPVRYDLAERLTTGVSNWTKRARTKIAVAGFSLRRLLQPLAGRARLEVHALLGPRRRPVLVASGVRTLAAGTPRKLVGTSTRRGKPLLRSNAPLKLRATLTFTPNRGKAVVVKRGFRLAS
jgi:hypothetical protein